MKSGKVYNKYNISGLNIGIYLKKGKNRPLKSAFMTEKSEFNKNRQK
jgi:hypothetical protein